MKPSPFERTEAADQEERDEESKNGEKDSGNHSATHPVSYRRIGADNQCDIARRFVCSISHLFRCNKNPISIVLGWKKKFEGSWLLYPNYLTEVGP